MAKNAFKWSIIVQCRKHYEGELFLQLLQPRLKKRHLQLLQPIFWTQPILQLLQLLQLLQPPWTPTLLIGNYFKILNLSQKNATKVHFFPMLQKFTLGHTVLWDSSPNSGIAGDMILGCMTIFIKWPVIYKFTFIAIFPP